MSWFRLGNIYCGTQMTFAFVSSIPGKEIGRISQLPTILLFSSLVARKSSNGSKGTAIAAAPKNKVVYNVLILLLRMDTR
jgi:hypothetical protein